MCLSSLQTLRARNKFKRALNGMRKLRNVPLPGTYTKYEGLSLEAYPSFDDSKVNTVRASFARAHRSTSFISFSMEIIERISRI